VTKYICGFFTLLILVVLLSLIYLSRSGKLPAPLAQTEIQGEWTLLTINSADHVPGLKFSDLEQSTVITSQSIIVHGADGDLAYEYKLNSSVHPKTIDWIEKEEVIKGIYALQGDLLHICLAGYPGQDRPTQFTAKATPQSQGILTFKKKKP
jgi:uncharacterized protein (TIGR03067 family)